MGGCWAPGCSNNNKNGFLFHSFPTCPIRRLKWAQLVKRRDPKEPDKILMPTRYARLCQAHFAYDMYENKRLDGKRLLRYNAAPTIFGTPSKSLPKKSEAQEKNKNVTKSTNDTATVNHIASGQSGFSQLLSAAKIIDSGISTGTATVATPSTTTTSIVTRATRKRTGEAFAKEVRAKRKVNAAKPAAPVGMVDSNNRATTRPITVHKVSLQSLIKRKSTFNTQPAVKSMAEVSKQKQEKQQKKQQHIVRVERVPLQAKVRRSQLNVGICCSSKARLAELEREMSSIKGKYLILKHKFEEQQSQLSAVFNADQLRAFTRMSTQGMKWESNTIENSRRLMAACGVRAYEMLLADGYPLPSRATMDRARRAALKEAKADIESTFIKDTEEELNTVTNTELACN